MALVDVAIQVETVAVEPAHEAGGHARRDGRGRGRGRHRRAAPARERPRLRRRRRRRRRPRRSSSTCSPGWPRCARCPTPARCRWSSTTRFLGLDADETSSTLLRQARALSESVQIIYLSDDPMIIEWTPSASASSRAAAVSTAPADVRAEPGGSTASGAPPDRLPTIGSPSVRPGRCRGRHHRRLPSVSWPPSEGRTRRSPPATSTSTVAGSVRHQDYEHELELLLRSGRERANGTESVADDLGRIEDYVKGGIDRSTTRGPRHLLLLGPRPLARSSRCRCRCAAGS